MHYSPIPITSFKNHWLDILEQERAIAVIRSPRFSVGLACAEAVAKAGFRLMEITWNSNQPAELVAELRIRFPHCLIGAGTILTTTELEIAIASGVQFVFSPHYNPVLLKLCLEANIPCIPGALSPTEIVTAWQAGASALKVFPVSALGGASYIKSLKSPLSEIPLIPTGGVNHQNAPTMIQAGAIAVGLSGALFPTCLVETENWQQISDRASALITKLRTINSIPT